MKLSGLRPKGGDEKDKICLNFYITEKAGNLKNLMLDKFEDIYFVYWLVSLVPIYDNGHIYQKFIQGNSWLKEYLPNWQPINIIKRRRASQGFSFIYYDLIDLLIGGLEQTVKKYQLGKMPNNLKELMNKDTRVVINDQILKLHTKDRREEYFLKYQGNINSINL
jgi:hypothetical protein